MKEGIIAGDSLDPHAFLGLHFDEKGQVIRLFRPHTKYLHLEVLGKIEKATLIDDAGLFEYRIKGKAISPLDYRIYHESGLLAEDPYIFAPTLSELDQYLFSRGVHYRIFDVLGAHIKEQQGVKGVQFAVFAPNAKRVSLVADFNHYDGRVNQMRSFNHSGIFEIFIPGLKKNEKYKFEIKAQDGTLQLKSDPFAFQAEMRPKTASIVTDLLEFTFTDDVWMQKRKEVLKKDKPMLIYEVHLGSWKKNGDAFLNYREIAKELSSYCREMNFTHVELLPIQEHPLDESWGYQVSGYYAMTSRFGSLQDFQWFVDHLHENNIAVLLDWVPGHFPTDDFSLGLFDGTPLYEHVDEKQGLHPHWTTYVFNYGRYEVSNFLIANALFLLEYMHIDGLRVDAIASMLYLDYGRGHDFIRNKHGGNENIEAIEFIKHLNSIVHQKFPDVVMIAEESTSFPGITSAIEAGGLGFDLKWNMGWMNDSLKYFSHNMLYRNYHQNELTFSLLYAFSEKFVLVLSHDEVVHGKASLIGKMPGDYWQQFANLRLLYSYMMCHPGKKLLFMGGEIGQFVEWSSKSEVEWFLLTYEKHQGMQKMVKNLNKLYLNSRALFEDDFSSQGFEWVDFSDIKNNVIIYLRKSTPEIFLCVHNFAPHCHTDYLVKLANISSIIEVFNSDASLYGGTDQINQNPKIDCDKNHRPTGVKIEIAPLATMIFKVSFQ